MTQRIARHLTFVLGGARSGKSAFAEGLVCAHPAPWTYIATAQAFDDEMRARIDMHRARRNASWITVDAPLALADALSAATPDAPVLVDCLTLWLTNHMLAGTDLAIERENLVAALCARRAPTVVVSSEVGQGIVPDNALARRFRDEAGVLHQAVAACAGAAHFIVAGLPLRLK